MSPVPSIIPSDILVLVGPILIGNLVTWLLLGILSMQLYVYYLCFPKDRWWIKFTAYSLYLLDLIQTVAATNTAWASMCTGWGNPTALVHTDWGFFMVPIASALVSSWVQLFFAWRVWALGNTKFWKAVTIVIFTTALVQTGAAIATGIKYAYINDTEKIYLLNSLVSVWLGGSAITDCLIAASMVYLLISARKCTWSRVTDKKITKLIRSTLETGVLSAAAALIDLGLYLGYNQNNIHVAVAMTLSKLYSNALMASLNSRAGGYERCPTNSHVDERHLTSGHLNTAQLTSVGIALTVDDSMNTSGTAVPNEYAKSVGQGTEIHEDKEPTFRYG